ncbi:MAG: hypothetical protein ACO4CU_13790 [Ilumatobacteraceae bacterium]
MIVCPECGTRNADGDLFCGGCPAFLEHSGELVDPESSLPEPVTAAMEASSPDAGQRDGLVARLKHAIGGDLPPPSAASQGVAGSEQGSEGKTGFAPPTAPILDEQQERARRLVAPKPEDAPQTGVRAPQAATPRPKRAVQAPSRKILPGDLICGSCGEGNPETRKFCRRCGNSLVEAEVKKAPWWRRVVPARRKRVLKASERPDRGSNRSVGTKARIFRGKVLGRLADARRLLALLALLGIGVGFVIPSTRTTMVDGANDLFGKVRRTISPSYSNIPIDPARVSASSEIEGAAAVQVTDSNTLTFWQGAADDASPSVTVTFVEPTDVAHVLVHPGEQESGGKVVRPDPRPREILLRVLGENGTVTEVPALLVDEDGFQLVELGVERAVSVEAVVVNCFPDPEVTVCPMTELEFQTRD